MSHFFDSSVLKIDHGAKTTEEIFSIYNSLDSVLIVVEDKIKDSFSADKMAKLIKKNKIDKNQNYENICHNSIVKIENEQPQPTKPNTIESVMNNFTEKDCLSNVQNFAKNASSPSEPESFISQKSQIQICNEPLPFKFVITFSKFSYLVIHNVLISSYYKVTVFRTSKISKDFRNFYDFYKNRSKIPYIDLLPKKTETNTNFKEYNKPLTDNLSNSCQNYEPLCGLNYSLLSLKQEGLDSKPDIISPVCSVSKPEKEDCSDKCNLITQPKKSMNLALKSSPIFLIYTSHYTEEDLLHLEIRVENTNAHNPVGCDSISSSKYFHIIVPPFLSDFVYEYLYYKCLLIKCIFFVEEIMKQYDENPRYTTKTRNFEIQASTPQNSEKIESTNQLRASKTLLLNDHGKFELGSDLLDQVPQCEQKEISNSDVLSRPLLLKDNGKFELGSDLLDQIPQCEQREISNSNVLYNPVLLNDHEKFELGSDLLDQIPQCEQKEISNTNVLYNPVLLNDHEKFEYGNSLNNVQSSDAYLTQISLKNKGPQTYIPDISDTKGFVYPYINLKNKPDILFNFDTKPDSFLYNTCFKLKNTLNDLFLKVISLENINFTYGLHCLKNFNLIQEYEKYRNIYNETVCHKYDFADCHLIQGINSVRGNPHFAVLYNTLYNKEYRIFNCDVLDNINDSKKYLGYLKVYKKIIKLFDTFSTKDDEIDNFETGNDGSTLTDDTSLFIFNHILNVEDFSIQTLLGVLKGFVQGRSANLKSQNGNSMIYDQKENIQTSEDHINDHSCLDANISSSGFASIFTDPNNSNNSENFVLDNLYVVNQLQKLSQYLYRNLLNAYINALSITNTKFRRALGAVNANSHLKIRVQSKYDISKYLRAQCNKIIDIKPFKSFEPDCMYIIFDPLPNKTASTNKDEELIKCYENKDFVTIPNENTIFMQNNQIYSQKADFPKYFVYSKSDLKIFRNCFLDFKKIYMFHLSGDLSLMSFLCYLNNKKKQDSSYSKKNLETMKTAINRESDFIPKNYAQEDIKSCQVYEQQTCLKEEYKELVPFYLGTFCYNLHALLKQNFIFLTQLNINTKYTEITLNNYFCEMSMPFLDIKVASETFVSKFEAKKCAQIRLYEVLRNYTDVLGFPCVFKCIFRNIRYWETICAKYQLSPSFEYEDDDTSDLNSMNNVDENLGTSYQLVKNKNAVCNEYNEGSYINQESFYCELHRHINAIGELYAKKCIKHDNLQIATKILEICALKNPHIFEKALYEALLAVIIEELEKFDRKHPTDKFFLFDTNLFKNFIDHTDMSKNCYMRLSASDLHNEDLKKKKLNKHTENSKSNDALHDNITLSDTKMSNFQHSDLDQMKNDLNKYDSSQNEQLFQFDKQKYSIHANINNKLSTYLYNKNILVSFLFKKSSKLTKEIQNVIVRHGINTTNLFRKMKKIFITHIINQINANGKLEFNKAFEQTYSFNNIVEKDVDIRCKRKLPDVFQKFSDEVSIYGFSYIDCGHDQNKSKTHYEKNPSNFSQVNTYPYFHDLNLGIGIKRSFTDTIFLNKMKIYHLKNIKLTSEMKLKLCIFQIALFSVFFKRTGSHSPGDYCYYIIPLKNKEIDWALMNFLCLKNTLKFNVYCFFESIQKHKNCKYNQNKETNTKDKFLDSLNVQFSKQSKISLRDKIIKDSCEMNTIKNHEMDLHTSKESFNQNETLEKTNIERLVLYNPYNKLFYKFIQNTQKSILEKTDFSNYTYKDYFENKYNVTLKNTENGLFIGEIFEHKDEYNLPSICANCEYDCNDDDIVEKIERKIKTGMLRNITDTKFSIISKDKGPGSLTRNIPDKNQSTYNPKLLKIDKPPNTIDNNIFLDLDDVHNPEDSILSQNNLKTNNNGSDINYLSTESIYITSIHESHLNSIKFIPLCLHLLETASLADELNKKLRINLKTQQILKSITKNNKTGQNYERVEFLGDSVLKYAASKYLLLRNKNFNKIAGMKDSIINNFALFQVAKEIGLPNYFTFSEFSIKQFQPPNLLKVFQDFDTSIENFFGDTKICSGDLFENTGVKNATISKYFKYFRADGIFKYTSNKNLLNNIKEGDLNYYIKTYSDILEAIIGSIYLEHGFEKSERFIHESGITKNKMYWKKNKKTSEKKLHDSKNNEQRIEIYTNTANIFNSDVYSQNIANYDEKYTEFLLNFLVPERSQFFQEITEQTNTLSIENIRQLETCLNYKFRHEGLLERAVVHPSFQNNPLGSSNFNKLELLGDSALDLIVTTEIYKNKKLITPEDLHKTRKSLVNNFSLARMLFKIGLNEHIKVCFDENHMFEVEKRLIKDGEKVNKIYSDIFEAICGAIIADLGMDFKKFSLFFMKNLWTALESCSDMTR